MEKGADPLYGTSLWGWGCQNMLFPEKVANSGALGKEPDPSLVPCPTGLAPSPLLRAAPLDQVLQAQPSQASVPPCFLGVFSSEEPPPARLPGGAPDLPQPWAPRFHYL